VLISLAKLKRRNTNETKFEVSGDNGGEDPPDPISNSEVKLTSADGTARETVWESRTLPEFF
jgi:hypothetical protein